MNCGSPLLDVAHAIIIIGYRYQYADDTLQVQIKSSWGDKDKSEYGYSIYQWIDINTCNLGGPGFYVLDGISVSDDTTDADGDQIPDYRDLCVDLPSTNRNLDGDTDSASYTMTIGESTPVEVASYSGWSANALALHGETALVMGRKGIEAVDISDPEAPVLIHRRQLTGDGHAIQPCGSQTMCLASTHTSKRLRTIDVSDPSTLAILGDAFPQGQSRGLSAGEGRVYMAAYNFGVEVFDVSDPATPVWVDNLDTGDWVVDVLWSRGVLYVANAGGSVSVFRVPRYTSPELIGTITTMSHPVELRLAGTALLVAELDDGQAWTKCHAGLSCRGGDRAEAFDTRLETWGAKLGEWSGDEVSWVYAHALRENLLAPTADGFTVYQVQAP